MKNSHMIWVAGASIGLALTFGACEKKGEDTAPSSVGTSQAPAPEKSPGVGSSPDTGAAQGQKPEDTTNKAQKG